MLADIQVYREMIKQIITSNMAYYKAIAAAYAASFKAWVAANMGAFFNTFQYYAAQVILNLKANAVWAIEALSRNMIAGLKALQYGIQHFPDFLHWCGLKMLQGITTGLDLLQFLVTSVFNVTNFFFQTFLNCLSLVGDIFKFLGNALLDKLETFGTIVKTLAEIAWELSIAAVKFLGTKAFNFVGATLGICYGICAVTVDLGADLVNGFFSYGGVNLAQYAAFEMLKTGLGVALTAFAAYHVAKLSYVGLAAVLSGSLLAQCFQKPVAADGNLQYAPDVRLDRRHNNERRGQDAVPAYTPPPAYTPANDASVRPSAPPDQAHDPLYGATNSAVMRLVRQ